MGYTVEHNKTFKLPNLSLLRYHKLTSQRWQVAVDHVIQEEGKMWEADGIVDNVVDRLIDIGDAETTSEEEGGQTRNASVPHPTATKLSLPYMIA